MDEENFDIYDPDLSFEQQDDKQIEDTDDLYGDLDVGTKDENEREDESLDLGLYDLNEKEISSSTEEATKQAEPEQQTKDSAPQQPQPGSQTALQPLQLVNKQQARQMQTTYIKSAQPQIHSGTGVDPNTTISVGNLTWWTTDKDLEDLCSSVGKVKQIKFFENKPNGRSKGYALVEYYDAVSAKNAAEQLHGRVLDGKSILVNFVSQQTLQELAMQQQVGGKKPKFAPQGGAGGGAGGGVARAIQQQQQNLVMMGVGRAQAPQISVQPLQPIQPLQALPPQAQRLPQQQIGRGRGFIAAGRGFPGPGVSFTPSISFAPGPGIMNQMSRARGLDGRIIGHPGAFPPQMMPEVSLSMMGGLAGVAPHLNPAFFKGTMGLDHGDGGPAADPYHRGGPYHSIRGAPDARQRGEYDHRDRSSSYDERERERDRLPERERDYERERSSYDERDRGDRSYEGRGHDSRRRRSAERSPSSREDERRPLKRERDEPTTTSSSTSSSSSSSSKYSRDDRYERDRKRRHSSGRD